MGKQAAVVVMFALAGCGAKPDSGGDEARTWGGPTAGTTDDGLWAVSYTSAPDPIPFNVPFAVIWELRALQGAPDPTEMWADLWMPEHQHGGATLPTTQPVGAQGDTVRFETTDLQLHMPGDWELQLRIDGGGQTDTLILPYTCCAGYAEDAPGTDTPAPHAVEPR